MDGRRRLDSNQRGQMTPGYEPGKLPLLTTPQLILVPRPGLEPGTYGLSVRCSAN